MPCELNRMTNGRNDRNQCTVKHTQQIHGIPQRAKVGTVYEIAVRLVKHNDVI
jgi:hypothetical protein